MKDTSHDQNVFDVIEKSGTDVLRYITIIYKGAVYNIPQEKMWSVLGQKYSKVMDRWFNDAKYIDNIFGDEHGFYMSSAVGALISFVSNDDVRLPIKNIGINKLKGIANSSGDYTSYFRSLIQ